MALEDNIEYLRVVKNLVVEHGVDGWLLDDMTWYQEDGVAVFQYERIVPGEGVELAVVERKQPTLPGHVNWSRKKDQGVLGLLEKDWLRWERGIDLNPEVVEYDA